MTKRHQTCIRKVIHIDSVIPTTIIMSGEHGRKYSVTVIEQYRDHVNQLYVVCDNREAALREIKQQKKNRKK